MAVEFRLPDVGEGIREAEIRRWLVSEGERVQEFDPIVEVQTDKAVVELPAPVSGRIVEIRTPAGAVAKVGEVLVVLEPSASVRSSVQGIDATTSRLSATAREQHVPAFRPPNRTPGTMQKSLATPGVRHFARQAGVALDEISGTGPGGRVERADVERAMAGRDLGRLDGKLRVAPNAQPDAMSTRVPFRGLRRATADHVVKSAFTAPHVTAFDDCEATALVALRNRWNEALQSTGKRVTYLPFLIKAVISALKQYPYFNARLHEAAEEIELLPDYHIGIAVDAPEGLMVPVIHAADQLSVAGIAEETERLTRGAKERTLTSAQLRGSTFTLTNMGPIGGLFATPIINYPEVAILAVHTIMPKPVVRDEAVVIRDMLTLSLSFDHRVIDGASAVRFMNHVKRLIENPDLLLLELR